MFQVVKFIDTYLKADNENLEKELDLLKEEDSKGASMLIEYIQNQGAMQKAYETADKLIQNGIFWNVIEDCTGISKPEYEKWLAEKK